MRTVAIVLIALTFFVSEAPAIAADLTQLIADVGSPQGRVVESAFKQLQAMGPTAAPAVPAIVEMLKAKKTFAEEDFGLDNVVYPEAFQTVKLIGSQSDDVLQVAMDYFQNSADALNAKPYALQVIADYGEKAAPLVPALVASLNNNKAKFRNPHLIVAVLGKIGPAAEPALPTLIKLATTNVSGSERAEAFLALKTIAPHDRRVLHALTECAAQKPGNSGDMEVGKAFLSYLSTYTYFTDDDLSFLASYLTKITDRDERDQKNAGHIMSSEPTYLDVAKIFISYPDKSDLIMASLAARIHQLDLHTKDFRAMLDLAGSFGVYAAPLIEPIYQRATSREQWTAGWLQPVSAETLQKIGTPDAVEKAKSLSLKR